jgi:YD repeat-containing protein
MKSPSLLTSVVCSLGRVTPRLTQSLVSVALLALSFGAPRAWGQQNPVFDAKGAQPNRPTATQLPWERVDPMTGNLSLSFTDLSLPGNAGFDLNIQRTYNSKMLYGWGTTEVFEEDSWAGLGWNLHFGRVLNHASTSPGPTIEMADGSQHQLFQKLGAPAGSAYVTREHWLYVPGTTPILKMPNGIIYEFGHVAFRGGFLGNVLYATEIRDPFGNAIHVNYACSSPCLAAPTDAIATVDQVLVGGQTREVAFEYEKDARLSLKSMTYEGRTWTYTSTAIPNQSGFTRLMNVAPPIGPSWAFTYQTTSVPRYELNGVTTPNGGHVDYVINTINYGSGSDPEFYRGRAVVTRSTSGTDIIPGSWTYTYGLGIDKNQTRVDGPCGGTTPPCTACTSTTYTFRGIGLFTSVPVWQMGLLDRTEIREGSILLQSEQLEWIPSEPISSQGQVVNTQQDLAIWTPLLWHRKVTRVLDYDTYHTYHTTDFSDYGRPWKTVETGELTRTTTRVFKYGFTPYIVDKVESEAVTVTGGGTFSSSFVYDLSNGFVKTVTIRGITTTFEKDSGGNVFKIKDANGNETTSHHSWGRVRKVDTAVGFSIDREIAPDGTMTWEKRRGFKTSFDYDDLFRLRHTYPPLGNPIEHEYDNVDGRFQRVKRGQLISGQWVGSLVTTNVDGFGRPSSTTNNVGVQADIDYDACGHRTYESYPYTSSNIGTHYLFDGLDRVKRKTNPDTTFATYQYGQLLDGLPSGIDTTVTDEKARITRLDHSAFGDPDEVRLMRIQDANGKWTAYSYNTLGALTNVTLPGNVGRSWTYYPGKSLLHTETHPESGMVTYTYEPNGNLKDRTDAARQLTKFTYDDNNRLREIDFPGDDYAKMTYDASDNRLTLNTRQVKSTFDYDDANRLKSRADVVDGKPFVTSCVPDANDNVERITYPTGTVARYFYDNENRIDRITRGELQTPYFANNFQYHPSGGILSYQAFNGQVHSTTYDPQRYWITDVDAGSALHLDYREYDNVGNVGRIHDSRPGFSTQDLQFLYDDLDRLENVEGWAKAHYGYDDLGNRRTKQIGTGPTVTYAYSPTSQRLLSSTAPEAASFDHDANGNMKTAGTSTFTFTPANMMKTATVAGATTKYFYDGDNLRKQKINGTTKSYYLHGLGGQILSEYELVGVGDPAPVRDYVYAGSRLIASVKPPVLSVTTLDVLTFAAVVNGPLTGWKTIKISSGDPDLDWQIEGIPSWLQVTPTSGSVMPMDVTLRANPAGLPVGVKVADIWVRANGAAGSPKKVKVRFVITSTPALAVEPTSLRFLMVEGDDVPSPQTLDVVYSGTGSANWTAGVSATPPTPNFLGLAPSTGTTPTLLTVTPTVSTFAAGTYLGEVAVTSTGTTGSPRKIPVTFVVQPRPGADCSAGAWYCEPFDGLNQADLAGQDGWELPPPDATSPQVVSDPRGEGNVMDLDAPAGSQMNSLRSVSNQSIDTGFELSMQVMSTGVPSANRQVAKIEFFTAPGVAWGKTKRTFGALRFGSSLYLQFGANVYQVLVGEMEPDRWYVVKVEYHAGRIDAYVDGEKKFSTTNPLVAGQFMQAFALTGWDFPGTGQLDLIEGRPLTSGMVVEPLQLQLKTVGGGPCPDCKAGAENQSSRTSAGATVQNAAKPPAGVAYLAADQPLRFEANLGQTDAAVKYLARGRDHALFLTPQDARLALRSRSSRAETGEAARAIVRMSFVGANESPEIIGRTKLPGVSNYLIGNDPSKWRTGVPHYADVTYRDLYPGIDLVFHGLDRRLEYDFVVAPDADPASIRLAFDGVQDIQLAPNGNLVLKTGAGEVVQTKPVIYQDLDGVRTPIEGGYVLDGADRVGFRVARYDAAKPLVIDPVLEYATFLGGGEAEAALDVAVDEDLNIYVTGATTSADFPTVAAHQPTFGSGDWESAFVTKFAPDGSHLVYSTYLGGVVEDGPTEGVAIAVQPDGTAFVAGNTRSATFPLVAAWQSALQGIYDGFLAKLDPAGVPIFSSYVGGPNTEFIGDVALSPSGSSVFVVGTTDSPNIGGVTPTLVNQSPGQFGEAFVARYPAVDLPTQATGLVFLNGAGNDSGRRIVVDASNGVYVASEGSGQWQADPSLNPFPVSVGAYHSPTPATLSNFHVYVTKLDWSGALPILRYSALISGSGEDYPSALAIKPGCASDCSAYVAGTADSTDFPQVGPSLGPGMNFVAELNATGSQLVYSTQFVEDTFLYFGPGMAVDAADNIYVGGHTRVPFTGCQVSSSFGVPNGSGKNVDPSTAFVNKINPDRAAFGYCAFLRGQEAQVRALTVDPTGLVLAVGEVRTRGVSPQGAFPTTPNAYDGTFDGLSDAFLVAIGEPVTGIQFSAGTYATTETSGGSTTTVYVKRGGDLTIPVTVNYATSNGTATAPGDYQSTSGTLSFAPGQSTQSFVVQVNDDTAPEPTETVNLVLSGASAPLGNPSTAIVLIADNDSTCATFTVRDRILPTGPSWTATLSPASLGTLSATSGTGPSTVTVCGGVQPAGPGTYQGTITVTGNTGNSPQVINVTLVQAGAF